MDVRIKQSLKRMRYPDDPQARFPGEFPKVVVQLPMFNERNVCANIIDAACELKWPRHRILIQILVRDGGGQSRDGRGTSSKRRARSVGCDRELHQPERQFQCELMIIRSWLTI
eukprot:7585205-Pyramimonas_sp.AAC.1